MHQKYTTTKLYLQNLVSVAGFEPAKNLLPKHELDLPATPRKKLAAGISFPIPAAFHRLFVLSIRSVDERRPWIIDARHDTGLLRRFPCLFEMGCYLSHLLRSVHRSKKHVKTFLKRPTCWTKWRKVEASNLIASSC
jgi:hypothetical protein